MNADIFFVWAAILRRVSRASLWLQEYDLSITAIANLEAELRAQGVFAGAIFGSDVEVNSNKGRKERGKSSAAVPVQRGSRLFSTPQQPWINHVQAKAAADLALDTPTKNMHTTSLDALFAGVPIVTLAGDRVSQRAAMSNIEALFHGGVNDDKEKEYGSDKKSDGLGASGAEFGSIGRVFSLKQYEDVAVSLATDPVLLARLHRAITERRLACGGVFDARHFAADFLALAHATTEAKEKFFLHEYHGDNDDGHCHKAKTTTDGAAETAANDPCPLQAADNSLWHKGGLWMAHRSRSKSFRFKCTANSGPSAIVSSDPSPSSIVTFSALPNLGASQESLSSLSSGEPSASPLSAPMGAASRRWSEESFAPPLLVNIGASARREGWLAVNIMSDGGPAGRMHGLSRLSKYSTGEAAALHGVGGADIVSAMDDLHMFDESSVTAIYASHVLEHASYRLPRKGSTEAQQQREQGQKQQWQQHENQGAGTRVGGARVPLSARFGDWSTGEIAGALSEWHRVLKPGGALFVAVPDLATLVNMHRDESLSFADRYMVMRMMFGGQVDAHDFHYTGFNEDLLAHLLGVSVASPFEYIHIKIWPSVGESTKSSARPAIQMEETV